jgi:alpha-D-ribose 1-methylphosphonate 5-triphosphate diphosphatase
VSDEKNESLAITDAVIVLPERVIESGAVGLRDGRIAEVSEDNRLEGDYEQAVSARGAYLVPGIIDVHNDSLETEINPRPETNLPVEFALANLERRLLASGVTTEFHAISFMDNARTNRSVGAAAHRAAYVAEYATSGRQLVANNVLHRLDVWSPATLDYIFGSLERQAVRYVSINDHTPGQGQYRDLEGYKERMELWREQRGRRIGIAADEVDKRILDRASDTETVPMVYERIRAEKARLGFLIASHDDDSAFKVDVLHDLAACITEFPVTFEAAERAREHGMTIVVGAPNIVRGGSSSGNLSAGELFERGLADVICADYHAPSLLPAAFRLVDDAIIDLPTAIRALAYNAARGLALENTGAVRTGYAADLILVSRIGRRVPEVERVFRGGRQVLMVNQSRRVEVPA